MFAMRNKTYGVDTILRAAINVMSNLCRTKCLILTKSTKQSYDWIVPEWNSTLKRILLELVSPRVASSEDLLASMPNAEVSVITLPHLPIGPVFSYIVGGSRIRWIPARRKQTVQASFYQPPRSVSRMLRNVGRTQPAKLLIVQVG